MKIRQYAPLLVACYSTALGAQTANMAKMVGTWSGPLVTDALRASITLAVAIDGGKPSITTTIIARDRTIVDKADSVVMAGDSLRFGNNIAGSRAHFAAALRDGVLEGTITALNGVEVAASGVWRAKPVVRGAKPSVVGSMQRQVLDAVWVAIDERYGNFACKRVDWNTVGKVFSGKVGTGTDDSTLFATVSAMLGTLNDNHVSVRTGDRVFRSGTYGASRAGEFSLDVVAKRYVRGVFTYEIDSSAHYGWLAGSVGYVHFESFRGITATADAMDSAIEYFKGAHGLVIDVRDNRGGSDLAALQVLNRIADKRRPYMSTRARALSTHDSYLSPHHYSLDPSGVVTFPGPVIVLTNRRTISAAENLLLGIRTIPNAMIVGDISAGAFSDVTRETLPNGWVLAYPLNTATDADGRCWEGLGVAPDIRAINEPAAVAGGKDSVLELALAVLAARSRP